jgi:hypothetical protein
MMSTVISSSWPKLELGAPTYEEFATRQQREQLMSR